MNYDDNWVAAEEAKRQWMNDNGLYKAVEEHASCGVGLVVSIDGKASRGVVENGIDALKAVWHRGAVDADGKTGDGAGIHVQIPVQFFYDQVRRTGHEPDADKLIAVGQVFLPRTDHGAQERCRTIVEAEVLRMGHYIYGWRHVPVNVACLGDKANATRPEIEQILIRNEKDIDEDAFERELYIRWVCGGLDRNGLRPLRYVVTGDGLLIAGSEVGMVPIDEATVVEKGALGPGQMIAVDMQAGVLFHDTEIKDKLAASQPFGEWVEKVVDLNEMTRDVPEVALFDGADLRTRSGDKPAD